MPDAACRYSSSEIGLYGLKKSIIHFQYLLKYAHFTVIMDNSALRMIYASKKESKTNRIQKYLEELSDYSFTIEHSPGTKMFISDYLSRFSADNIETDSIPFLTSRKDLTVNGTDLINLDDFDPIMGGNMDMSLCSDGDNTNSNGVHPLGLPVSYHKNATTQRTGRTVKRAVRSIDNDNSQRRKRKYTAENPPRNSDVIEGARGGQVPEIKPIKKLNFRKPDKQQDKAVYSDKIDMDDEIKSTLRDVEKTARITAENLAVKIQEALGLSFK